MKYGHLGCEKNVMHNYGYALRLNVIGMHAAYEVSAV